MYWARKSLRSFFVRYEVPWEITMMALAVVFVALGFLPDVVHMGPQGHSLVDKIDWAITFLFALEFAVRIGIAPSRKRYLRDHWTDLVAIIPFFRIFRVARLARVVRLLRLLLLIRFFRDLDLAFLHLKGIGRQWGFFKFLIATVVIAAAAAGVATMAERDVNPSMTSYPQALWWAVATLTTVGYGDVVPITTVGRLAAVVMMVGGFVLWSLFIASTVAYLSSPRRKDEEPIIAELKGKLDRLSDMSEGELIALQGALDALITAKRQGRDSLNKIALTPPASREHKTEALGKIYFFRQSSNAW